MNKSFQTLEFDKVLERVASFTTCEAAFELAQKIKPVRDNRLLGHYLTQTTELLNLILYDSSPPLDGLYDIRPPLKKLKVEGSTLSLTELAEVYSTLLVMRLVAGYVRSRKEKAPALLRLISRLVPLPHAEKELERCVDFKSGEVKDDASPELKKIRQSLQQARLNARKKLDMLLRSYGAAGMLQENVISVRDGRFVLVVRDEFKRKIKGLVHDQSASGSSYFIEPIETLEDNNRIRELEAEEHQEIQRILRQLTEMLRSCDELGANFDILTRFDLVHAKAVFAKSIEALQPEIVDEPAIELYDARHPLLLLRMGKKPVVPLSLSLGGQLHSLVISGPNAGGKTVALKTVGLLTLMARSGLLIPALPHSKIGTIHSVFAAIGDQQSIENDLSTFSSHLENLKEIAEKAGPQSLVLVDEIASGTDPDEGTALAMAFIEHLTKVGSLNIVTTHLSALKAFAYQTEGVENASLEFDLKSLAPTFHFRIGIPGSSYAFEIARRMGLPAEITRRARQMTDKNKNRLEGLVIELEKKLNEQKQLVARAHVKETEMRGMLALYMQKKQEIEKYEKQYKRKAAEEAEKIISDANALLEKTIREIRESGAERQVIKKARQEIQAQKERLTRLQEQPKQPRVDRLQKLQVGDYVRWEATGSEGTIASEPDKKNRVFLQAGGARIKVPLGELVKATPPKQRRTIVRTNLVSDAVREWELDLRGERLEEARERVDQFLDNALLSGLKEVRIIHGKGTGALRKGLANFLQSHPFVVNTRLGNWNEGDSGVTVVELREQ